MNSYVSESALLCGLRSRERSSHARIVIMDAGCSFSRVTFRIIGVRRMFRITYSNSLPTLARRPLALFEVLWQYAFPESTGNNLYRTPPAILRTPSIHTHPRALPGRITYSPSIHPKELEWLINNFWMYWPGIFYAQRDSHYDSQLTKVCMCDV